MSGVKDDGNPRPPSSLAGFKRRRPEPRPVAHGDAADRIDYRQRSDADAASRHRRCRTDAALEIRGGGAKPGADAAEREILSRRHGRGIAEIAVGREAAPGLVAAVEQIETDRAGHDRDQRAAYRKAAALFGQPCLHPAAGLQSERRAARQRDAVDLLHGVFEVEHRAFANAGTAAADVDRRHRGPVENDGGDAGRQRPVIGVADADAGNIGQEISHALNVQGPA